MVSDSLSQLALGSQMEWLQLLASNLSTGTFTLQQVVPLVEDLCQVVLHFVSMPVAFSDITLAMHNRICCCREALSQQDVSVYQGETCKATTPNQLRSPKTTFSQGKCEQELRGALPKVDLGYKNPPLEDRSRPMLQAIASSRLLTPLPPQL